jgi:hypothetical protein
MQVIGIVRGRVRRPELRGHENANVFLGMVKLQTGDISIVDNMETFLMWYDNLFSYSDFDPRADLCFAPHFSADATQ